MMIPGAGETKENIEEFAAADPAVKNGFLIFEIKPWFVAMKRTVTNAPVTASSK